MDHIIVLGEMHLRHILKSYADYYNCVRTHRSLNKDAPVSRPVCTENLNPDVVMVKPAEDRV